jgi:protein SCO1
MKRILPSLILLALLIGGVFFAKKYFITPDIPELYIVPDFSYQTQQGHTFSNKNFSDKITVADFIFTNCPGICPVMSNEMFKLYQDYEGSDQVQFVSFSIDPARDSIEALKQYAEAWGISDQNWYFLRTDTSTIGTFYEQGFKLGGELPFSHSTKFVLIDNKNYIRGYYDFDDPEQIEQLKENISVLTDDI